MKVLCIEDRWKDPHGKKQPGPAVGDTCTVATTERFYGVDFYTLENFGLTHLYRADCFAPVSDIDETTFERNYKKELV